MSVQKLDSSSRLKDISSLYLKSDENQDPLGSLSRNFIADENKDVKKNTVYDLPLLPVLPRTVDMDFELEQVPSNNYLLVDRTDSHMITKTGNSIKEDNLLSFDAYRNNIPSSSSVTQLGFVNKNTDQFSSEKSMENEGVHSISVKPKSANNVPGVKKTLSPNKSLSQNKAKQKYYNNQSNINDINIDSLDRIKPERLRPRSSIPLSKSKNLLSNIFNPADVDSDYGILNLRSISKGLRSNGVNLYLASSPPSTVGDFSIDRPRSNIELENRSNKMQTSFVDVTRRNCSLVTNYNYLIGGHSINRETAPLLLTTKNMARPKFEKFFKVKPRDKKVVKQYKNKQKNYSKLKDIKINTMHPLEPKTYLDEETKKHMIVFHNNLGKSYQPSHVNALKRKFSFNLFKTKNGVLFGECYMDILAHKNDNDFSGGDKAKMQDMMNILFLEEGQRVYTSLNGQDIYEIDSGKLQAMSRRYNRNGEQIAESEKKAAISEDEDAELSALKNILFLKEHQKRCSTATMERDLQAKSLVNMSNKEFTLNIAATAKDVKIEKSPTLKTSKPIKKKQQVKEKKIVKPKKSKKKQTKAKPLAKKPVKLTPPKNTTDCIKPKIRSKNGCWTCRLRKKKCTEEKEECANCLRMQVPCDYSADKPAYMATAESKRHKLLEVKRISVTNKQTSKKSKS